MNRIPLMVPTIDEDDINRASAVLRSGMLVQGKNVEELEISIQKLTSISNAVAVSNGTATLHLALLSLGVGKGDEVIVPAFSYVASANVVELVHAKPVFVDIDLETFNIDVNLIESAITPSTKAIMLVHEFGLSADIHPVLELCKKYNLYIVEDAACALGATYHGKPVGSFGDLGSFSFHPRKAITSGEGGVLVTDDDSLASKIRILRNHGIEIIEGKQEFVEAGFNYRLTDFQAALLAGQVDRFASIIKRRQQFADMYSVMITTTAVQLPVVPANCIHTWQTYHIVLDKAFSRDKIKGKLFERNIESNYGAQCIPAQKYYQKKYNNDSQKLFPNAWQAYTQGLALPMYDKLTEEQVNFVSEQLNHLTS